MADMSTPENQQRLQMGVFPQGCEIVPNPYNRIPGFFHPRPHARSAFLSWPGPCSNGRWTRAIVQCSISAAMSSIPSWFSACRVSHHAGDADRRIALAGVWRSACPAWARLAAPHIDLGVKGEPEAAAQACFLRPRSSAGRQSCRRPRPELDEGLNKKGRPFIQFKNPLPNAPVNFTIRERTVCCVAARPVSFGGAAISHQLLPMSRLPTPATPWTPIVTAPLAIPSPYKSSSAPCGCSMRWPPSPTPSR